ASVTGMGHPLDRTAVPGGVESAGKPPPVEYRHAHVEADERLAVHLRERFLPVLSRNDLVAVGDEDVGDDGDYRWIVVHHENAAQAVPPRGSTTWNVLPVPTRLSTEMRPPCCSTMPLQIKRPRPIPANRRSETFVPR